MQKGKSSEERRNSTATLASLQSFNGSAWRVDGITGRVVCIDSREDDLTVQLGSKINEARAAQPTKCCLGSKALLSNYLLVMSYFVTPMPIGTNFALMTVFWKQEWGKDSLYTGMLMTLGELVGLVMLTVL